jgi:hypothetical protein
MSSLPHIQVQKHNLESFQRIVPGPFTAEASGRPSFGDELPDFLLLKAVQAIHGCYVGSKTAVRTYNGLIKERIFTLIMGAEVCILLHKPDRAASHFGYLKGLFTYRAFDLFLVYRFKFVQQIHLPKVYLWLLPQRLVYDTAF